MTAKKKSTEAAGDAAWLAGYARLWRFLSADEIPVEEPKPVEDRVRAALLTTMAVAWSDADDASVSRQQRRKAHDVADIMYTLWHALDPSRPLGALGAIKRGVKQAKALLPPFRGEALFDPEQWLSHATTIIYRELTTGPDDGRRLATYLAQASIFHDPLHANTDADELDARTTKVTAIIKRHVKTTRMYVSPDVPHRPFPRGRPARGAASPRRG